MLSYFLFQAVKSDLEDRTIPDEASLGICILALGRGGFSLQAVNMALVLLIILGFIMGFGDAKLFASLSLLLGQGVLFVLASAFILAFIYCLLGLILGRLKLKDSIAFAPFIAPAACAIWYNNILGQTVLKHFF